MYESNRIPRGHQWLPSDTSTWPELYATEDVEATDKLAVAKYFCGNSTWWVCEMQQETKLAFGFVILGDSYQDAEFGYFDLSIQGELQKLRIVSPHGSVILIERDLDFTKPTLLRDVVPAEAWRF